MSLFHYQHPDEHDSPARAWLLHLGELRWRVSTQPRAASASSIRARIWGTRKPPENLTVLLHELARHGVFIAFTEHLSDLHLLERLLHTLDLPEHPPAVLLDGAPEPDAFWRGELPITLLNMLGDPRSPHFDVDTWLSLYALPEERRHHARRLHPRPRVCRRDGALPRPTRAWLRHENRR